MPAVAVVVVAAVASAAAQRAAARRQAKAQRKAAEMQAQSLREAQEAAAQARGEHLGLTGPAREIGLQQAKLQLEQGRVNLEARKKVLPLLQKDVLREPGTSSLFRRGLQEGVTGIMSNLAPFGLAESSVSGKAVGEFGADLLGQDIAQIRQARFNLANLTPLSFRPSVSPTAGLQGAREFAQQGINLGVSEGATQAAGHLASETSIAQGNAAAVQTIASAVGGAAGGIGGSAATQAAGSNLRFGQPQMGTGVPVQSTFGQSMPTRTGGLSLRGQGRNQFQTGLTLR